ncbi:phophatidylserine decarboxylase associated domain-containing protein [Kitasatospora sp. NPDC097691]|uniref:phophatidylserine decarboxylase associated domain-containing protein n=1 Tax=Kitasatospora sp. NPDC097691 TaxID=3157231 RepID=UPI00331BBA31
MAISEAVLETRYQNSYGRAAGFLPRNRSAVDRWHGRLLDRARGRTGAHLPPVADLADLLDADPVLRTLVTQTIKEVLDLFPVDADGDVRTVRTIDDLLNCLDVVCESAPEYTPVLGDQVFFPLSALFCHMMAVPSGWDTFRHEEFNRRLTGILTYWCGFLDSKDSREVLPGPDGWLGRAASEQYKLYEFEVDRDDPYGGFTSFNDFFHRRVKPEFRPMAEDPRAVISPNDGTVVRIYPNVREEVPDITVKAQPYSLRMMLSDYPDTARFVGGDVLQSFLSGADYHRWHAPVAGVVEYVENVPGLTFSELYNPTVDLSSGTLSQGYGASVNTRGIVVIDTGSSMGRVCVVPVGITEISSVTIAVRPGDRVERGDELGYFSYGGSSMCLVFERGKVDFTVPMGEHQGPDVVTDDGGLIFVNQQIAVPR